MDDLFLVTNSVFDISDIFFTFRLDLCNAGNYIIHVKDNYIEEVL